MSFIAEATMVRTPSWAEGEGNSFKLGVTDEDWKGCAQEERVLITDGLRSLAVAMDETSVPVVLTGVTGTLVEADVNELSFTDRVC